MLSSDCPDLDKSGAVTVSGRFCDRLNHLILWFGAANRRMLAADAFALAAAVYVGYAMRLSIFIGSEYMLSFAAAAVSFPAAVCLLMYAGKVYAVVWPRAGVEEYARMARWYGLGLCLFMLFHHLSRLFILPRSSFVIFALLGLVMITFSRAVLKFALISRSSAADGGRAVIVGAGEAGCSVARELLRNGSGMRPLGFVDDDPELSGMMVSGLKVLGCTKDLPYFINRLMADTVLITVPSFSGGTLKEYMGLLEGLPVKVRVLPSIADLAGGRVSVSRFRPVNLEDLLRRDPVRLDNEGISAVISGKTVMVTGAGGTIGSELCSQILSRGPAKLLALGHGEQSIYSLMETVESNGAEIVPVIADVADGPSMRRVFDEYRPHAVFHAAAHKHVPLMESNPREALRVNALGTWNVASLAGGYGAERFVMISTDKAVHPSSIMGATKRAAERLLLSAQRKYPDTKFMAVRFGNVLGSRGSVIPKFERQIEEGGPVTVTHPDMKRYFMLIPEAVSLVLEAGALGEGGELFLLDMGEPVSILEMAETLIRLHGCEPRKDIQIRYTGIRPGEKLYEELFYDPARADKTSHDKIFKSRTETDDTFILPEVDAILALSSSGGVSDLELKEKILALGV